MDKENLINHYVTFIDDNAKWRTEKVIDNHDKFITTENVLGIKTKTNKKRIIRIER